MIYGGEGMSKKLILLSGAHGVGKGYWLKQNFENDKNFSVLGASDLIRRYKEADDAGHKRVKNIAGNQDVLLMALNSERNKTERDIILDGHICLVNRNGEVECIPEEFVCDAGVSGIVLLQDCVEMIADRQQQRDKTSMSQELIEEIQETERAYCNLLNERYKMPYKIITSSCSREDFMQMTEKMRGVINE